MLEALKANRKRIVLATSKATHYAEIILKHFEILPYFEFVSGADMDGTRSGKAEVIAHALETCQINPETAAMAGDRKMDILGALACGATPIAVLYGYGSREELTAAGATVFADTTDDILKLVL
jgi:phosphoglycolate phosphatase